MTIIELLNKIANGEEVPKKIKYENRILYLEDEAEDYEPTFNYYDKDGENALFESWIGQYLNDEVEIIEEEPRDIEVCGSFFTKSEYDKLAKTEEDKKIEKLEVIGWNDCIHEVTHTEKRIFIEINKTESKLNEIIDYLMENKQ